MKTHFGVAVALVLSSVIASADSLLPLTITFTQSNVVISNVSRSAPVYVFSLERERKAYYTNIAPVDRRLTDLVGAGSITISYNHQQSWRSLWFAVDLSTGSFVVGAPPDYPWAKRIIVTASHLKRDQAGEIAQLAMNGELVEFIVVRPQVGVWGGLITSMGGLDDAKEKGKITVSIASLTPQAGTADPPPKKLKKGDVVFIANSFTGEYGAAVAE